MAAKSNSTTKVQPVAAHPLFAPFVTLWFGALFGLGSMAVHPSVLKDLLRQSRIEQMVSAALPPVDLTGRTLLALALTATGCLLGLGIARAVVRINGFRHRSRTGQEQVFILPDDLRSPFEAETVPAKQEPVLQAAEEEAVPSVAAPVIDQSRPVLDISAINLAPAHTEEPLDLAAFQHDHRTDEVPAPPPAVAIFPRQDAAPAIAEDADRDPPPWSMPQPQDRAGTERALREALGNLQRLRGAA